MDPSSSASPTPLPGSPTTSSNNNTDTSAGNESTVTSATTTTPATVPDVAAPQSFAAAMGFNPPKINTSAFFSSMQGKIQSTLANTKSPTLNLQPPQINKVDLNKIQAGTEQFANTTKDWGVSAFKSLSSAAQKVSANVTQGLQKEHEEFLKQKKLDTVTPHQGTEAVPAWAGLPDEDQFKARILSLSKDKRNFLLPPPPGTDFTFDMKVYSSTAMATLKEDPNLDKMRFYLVPKEVEELVFWRNYFYRVSLLKQLALASSSSGGAGAIDGLVSEAASTAEIGGGENNTGSENSRHARTLSVNSALGYNIYFGKDDVEGPPTRSRPTSSIKDLNVPSASSKEKATATKTEAKKSEVLFEAEMPDNEEDPDAWLEKQLASGVSIGDDDGDVDVADWEKELQNELKDYVEGA
ncbi:Synapse-associated protein 1 [Gryganskiella cystojenkinii]|nr:Synapse-associated protein 1 [Gryganskiella cystojenkinii]